MEIMNAPDVYVLQKVEGVSAVSKKAGIFKEEIVKSPAEELTKEKLVEKVAGMNEFLEPINTSVKFKFHDELGEFYVQVIDTLTDEILKEIPNKKFLDMYASMAEFAGLLVDEKF